MARSLRSGGDLHSMSAEKVYGDDFTLEPDPIQKKFLRNNTKAITFLLIYGGGATHYLIDLVFPKGKLKN